MGPEPRPHFPRWAHTQSLSHRKMLRKPRLRSAGQSHWATLSLYTLLRGRCGPSKSTVWAEFVAQSLCWPHVGACSASEKLSQPPPAALEPPVQLGKAGSCYLQSGTPSPPLRGLHPVNTYKAPAVCTDPILCGLEGAVTRNRSHFSYGPAGRFRPREMK